MKIWTLVYLIAIMKTRPTMESFLSISIIYRIINENVSKANKWIKAMGFFFIVSRTQGVLKNNDE